MKLAGKTALVARGATIAAVPTVLRREGARVETEATPAATAEKFGGTVILYGRAVAHPPAALLEPRRFRVNYVVADAMTPPHEIAEAVLHLASDDAFTTQGEEVVLTILALAS